MAKGKSKKDTGEIKDVVESALYKTIILQVEKIGIAIVSKNYVVFEEKRIGTETVHATLGYYGDKSLGAALEYVSAILLKNRLARKCRRETVSLEELRRIIDSHVRKFDKLLEGLEGEEQ